MSPGLLHPQKVAIAPWAIPVDGLGQNVFGSLVVSSPLYPAVWTLPHVTVPAGFNGKLKFVVHNGVPDGLTPQTLQYPGGSVAGIGTRHAADVINVGIIDSDGWNDIDGMADGT
jgi:hypothetical protein